MATKYPKENWPLALMKKLADAISSPFRVLDDVLSQKYKGYGRLAIIAISFPMLFSIIYASSFWKTGSGQAAIIFATMLIVSGAGTFAGLIAGFIFGIPRVVSGTVISEDPADQRATLSSPLRTNSNLEQVSDWLTTIVIGLTLINVKEIAHSLHTAGKLIAIAVSGKAEHSLSVLAPATGVYAFLVGFLCFYILTRTELAILFKRTEDTLNASSQLIELTEKYDETSIFNADGNQNADMDEVSAYAGKPLDKISGFTNVLTWARCNKLLNRVSATMLGYQRAFALKPDAVKERLEYARFLAKHGKIGLALDTIAAAEQEAKPSHDTILNLSRMFVYLYASNPSRYMQAIDIGENLKSKIKSAPELSTKPKRRAQLQFYLASAYGMAHRRAKREMKEKQQKSSAEVDRYKKATFEAVEASLNEGDFYRDRLRMIWNPHDKTKNRHDSELEQFYSDEAFQELLGEPGDPH
jgi:hypothetical protein